MVRVLDDAVSKRFSRTTRDSVCRRTDVHSTYTALIVREDPAERICVSGAVTVGAETIEPHGRW